MSYAILTVERCCYAAGVEIESPPLPAADVELLGEVYVSEGARYLGRARMADVASLICHGWLA